MPAVLLLAVAACPAAAATCNATLHSGMSIGGDAYKQLPGSSTAACCVACVADPKCLAFVTHAGGGGECSLKADVNNLHAKSWNDCGVVRGTPGPPLPPPPGPPPPPPPPSPPAPPGAPQWEIVEVSQVPVIGMDTPDVKKWNIHNGFETGQYQRLGNTFYYTANELGMCEGVYWDVVTRAALWSAPNSTGPWKRVTTLRNGSHMYTSCAKTKTPYPANENDTNFVTWAPTLVKAPSSVNKSRDVWNLFYSSNQNSHHGDKAFNGMTWAVSTTDSMEGPYVAVPPNAALPAGAEGITNVAVTGSHSFSAWRLANGTWAGFRNNIPGAKSFSAGLIVPVEPTVPGGAWRPAGPNLASGSDCDAGFCFAPENPVVTTKTMDGKYYLAVYDALHKLQIGTSFSADGVTWQHSAILTIDHQPCGIIRTPLGLAPEPERCAGCYSVLWTGQGQDPDTFRPVCHAIIRNTAES